MEKIRIITDAASDISYEDERDLDIRVLPFRLMLGNHSYIGRKELNNDEFYQLMAEYDEIPKTSQITPFEFQEVYLEEAKAGYTDLIFILINSEGSATYANSLLARELFFDEHPEYKNKVRIYHVDGRGYSALYGAPVVRAAQMARENKSAEEITEWLKGAIGRRIVYFGMYTLRYAGKSGRIPSAAAFVGDKLNLKPIMKIYHNYISTAAKVRGDAKLIARIADMTIADMKPGTPYEIIYGSDLSAREEMEAIMREKTGYAPSGYYQISAVIAANAGPRTVGTAFERRDG